MYGPLLSVLLLGTVPVWGLRAEEETHVRRFSIAPPVSQLAASLPFDSLDARLSASGVLIVDLESGQTLYESKASVPRPMASLTKLMTALLVVENHDLDEWVTMPADVEDIEGSRAKLEPRERFRVGDLLTAMLVSSANDAAVVLARHHAGSVEEFVDEMNARATSLGLKGTTYANPTGLDQPDQVSTPRDVVWLAMYVLKKPEIAKRMAIRHASIRSQSGTTLELTHTHTMLQKDSIVAGKTGTTDAAGQCLLSVVEHGGRRYGVILLNSADRYADMRRVSSVFSS
jgi:serine-type D-Ala-D-Ala carboxypeptidase (penicillin-binding protein 5/6)